VKEGKRCGKDREERGKREGEMDDGKWKMKPF